MMENGSYYNLFFRIIEKYGPSGFTGIDDHDPLMAELNEIMKKNNQFFYIGDLILFKILYTSSQCIDVLGIEPNDLSPISFLNRLHPNEIERDHLGRTMLIKLGQDLFLKEKGQILLSSNYRMINAQGGYSNFLMQFYIFYSEVPYKSVFALKVQTNIDWCKRFKHGFHYYLGEDLTNFRYPDHELLKIGNVLTNREIDIVRLLERGLSSEQIGKKLFLSTNTVNTHRRNILNKSGKANMQELIHELKEAGLL
jgi:DNA-binding CsgD family transcriptional regulator